MVGNSSGVFVTDTSAGNDLRITYSPTNSCDSEAADNFTFYIGSQTATNDHIDGNVGVTNNLLPLADMEFTLPTAPGDVY